MLVADPPEEVEALAHVLISGRELTELRLHGVEIGQHERDVGLVAGLEVRVERLPGVVRGEFVLVVSPRRDAEAVAPRPSLVRSPSRRDVSSACTRCCPARVRAADAADGSRLPS